MKVGLIQRRRNNLKRSCKNCEALDIDFYVQNHSPDRFYCRLQHKINNKEGVPIPCEECEKPMSMKKLIEIITKKGLPFQCAVYSRSNRGGFLSRH